MDLATTYMGLDLDGPLVPSASPLSQSIDGIKRMEEAGASAVVLWSVFEEQIAHDAGELEHYLQYGTDRWAESLTYFPRESSYRLGPEAYLEHISRAKQAVDIPVIASLNGISDSGWTSYAGQIAQAGADGLELNVYYIPALAELPAAQVEKIYLQILRMVKSSVSIPVAVKLSPFFSSVGNMLARLDEAGAAGLVLFNRFYQPDLDIDSLSVVPSLELSNSWELRLPLRWIAIMYGRVDASLAATTGIHTGGDVAKAVLAGADVAMVCSALLTHGIEHISTMREGLVRYMESKGYRSLSQMKGILSQASCPEPAVFERANYMKALTSYGQTATLE